MINELSILLKHHNLSLSSLMPTVFSSLIKTTKLSGLSNESFKLTFQDPDPSIVIKFYKNLFPRFVDRKVESQVIRILNEAAMIPQIYSQGDWGYSYRFEEGTELSHKDLNDNTLHAIVDTVIDMTMVVEAEEPQEEGETRRFENVAANCRQICEEMEQAHPNRMRRNRGLAADLLREDVVANILKVLPQESVFSHNDVNLTNLISTPTNGLVLMDYEFACQNYVGFDLGNLLNELTTQYSDGFEIRPEWEIGEGIKRQLVQKYFTLLERDTADMMRKVEVGRLLSHHFWFFVGLLSFNDPHCRLDLDYYLKRRHQEFFKYYNALCSY